MAFDPIAASALVADSEPPACMFIGDSIYNGVRSLSIDLARASVSPPAQLASAYGWPFAMPPYPRPLLFDIEELFRNPLKLATFRQDIVENSKQWWATQGAWSPNPFFDNISVAGATIEDLSQIADAKYSPSIPALIAKLDSNHHLDYGTIFDLYFALNTCFLMNPKRIPELQEATPLDLVALRKPKRLFLNIGSNNGFYKICISGKYDHSIVELVRSIPDLMEDLGRRLLRLPTETQHIYVNSLIRPRTVANLLTRVDPTPPYPGCERYYPEYIGRLGAQGRMTGDELRAFDALVWDVNQSVRTRLSALPGAKGRLHFVDLYEFSSALDEKHGCSSREVRVHNGQWRLSNFPISAAFGFRQGGLFGIDNMHPSAVGYALLAEHVAKSVMGAESIQPSSPFDLELAYKRDTLLSDLPDIDGPMFLFAFLGSLANVFSRASAHSTGV